MQPAELRDKMIAIVDELRSQLWNRGRNCPRPDLILSLGITELQKLQIKYFDGLATRCPICGGTEHVDPLPGTVGRRCVKCCNVKEHG
jgi:hypothetical protein